MKIKSNNVFRRYVISWFLLIVGCIVAVGGMAVYKSAENHLMANVIQNKKNQITAMANLIDGDKHRLIQTKPNLTNVYAEKLTRLFSIAANDEKIIHNLYSLNFDEKSKQLKYAVHKNVDYTGKNAEFTLQDVESKFLNVFLSNGLEQGFIENQQLDETSFYFYSTIKTNQSKKVGLLVLVVDPNTVLKIKEGIFRSMFLSFSLLSVLLMLAAIFFSRRITAPVEMLNIAIQRLIQNDFNFKLSTKEFGSFGFLAKQFNSMTVQLLKSRKELIHLNKSYSRFVPHQLLKQLSNSGVGDIALGDSCERMMTILFCDIRGFTTLSETMSPSANFKFINRYLSQIAPVINKNGGTIDKYLGDGIMALFPNGGDAALKAAIEMINALSEYNKKLIAKRLPIIEVGIGLHSGKTMLGTVGTPLRMDATAISDSVNAAARVEAMTKSFCTKILITEETKQELKDLTKYRMRYIANCQIQGKLQPVTLYEVYNNDPLSLQKEKAQNQSMMIKAWKAYKQGNPEAAIQIYQRLIEKSPNDKSLFALIERCQSGRL